LEQLKNVHWLASLLGHPEHPQRLEYHKGVFVVSTANHTSVASGEKSPEAACTPWTWTAIDGQNAAPFTGAARAAL